MRQIHPVSFREKFVASGTYVFERGGIPTGDVEYWSMHEPGPGSRTVRSDRDGREGSGANWLFEGLLIQQDDTATLERFDIEVISGTRQTQAQFVFDRQAVQVAIRTDEDVRTRETIPLPEGYRVRPPSLVVEYLFALDLVRTPGAWAPVYAPQVITDQVTVNATGQEVYCAEPGAADTMTESIIGGKRYPARSIRVLDERSLTHTRLWFGDNNVLLLCERGDTRAYLTRYVHRPEPT